MATERDGAHPKYRPDIDGLRAVAVLAVVAFHAYPTVYKGGFTGVDVFFVISGYLISTIIMGQLAKGTFSFAEFYSRRVRRIFPSLVLVLLACLVTGWLILLPTEYMQLGKHVSAGCSFVSNIVLWGESGYFDTNAETKVLLHLWSLGIEEQFYLVWPLLLFVFGVKRVRMLLGLGIAASFLLGLFMVRDHAVGAFYNPATRFWELLAGGALAHLDLAHGEAMARLRARASARHAMSVVGALLVATGLALLDKNQPFPGWRALLPVVGACLLIAAGPNAVVNRWVLSNRLAVWIGLISYPLYLWHWPALAFARIVEGLPPSFRVRTVAVIACVIASVLTYRFVERPLRHRKTALPLFGGNVALLGAGLAVLLRGGFAAARGPWNVDNVEQRFTYDDFSTKECKKVEGALFDPAFDTGRDNCVYTRPIGSAIDAMVVGDSHSSRIFIGLKDAAPELSLAMLGRGNCMPYLHFDGAAAATGVPLGCQPTMDRLLMRAVDVRPRVIVMAGYFVRPFDPEIKPMLDAPLVDLIDATFATFAKAADEVIVVLDVPLLQFEPSACVDRPFHRSAGHSNGTCPFPRTLVAEQRKIYEGDLRKAAAKHPKVSFFDPMDALCDDGETCFAVRERNLLWDDRHHLSRHGGKLVGEKLRARIERRAP